MRADNFRGATGRRGSTAPNPGAGRKKRLKTVIKEMPFDHRDIAAIILTTLLQNNPVEIKDRRDIVRKAIADSGVDAGNIPSTLQAWIDSIVSKGIDEGLHAGLVDLLELVIEKPKQDVNLSGEIVVNIGKNGKNCL